MTHQYNRLDPLTFPLYGHRLIEASAGTGKTYTIGSLYLRLLLGLGSRESSHLRPLTVDQILVVTFTVAATEELRERIRSRIHEMRLTVQSGDSDDPFLLALLAEIKDKKTAIKQLIAAEQQMDQASIFTIHGFCQRMLTQNAFESGSLFSKEFVMDESLLRLHVAQDFWRKYFYPLSASVLKNVLAVWNSPEKLLSDIQSYLGMQVKIISGKMQDENIEKEIQKRLEKVQKIKKIWPKERNNALNIKNIASDYGAKLNGNKYRDTSILNWVAEIDAWVDAHCDLLAIPDNLLRFAQDTLNDAMTKGSIPEVNLFREIQILRDEDLEIKPLLRAFAIAKIKVMLDKAKYKDQLMAFDDLLSRLAMALEKDQKNLLAPRIRSQYPIAMIDEFQDTDPLQYQIFSRIYGVSSEENRQTGLFMIGDPKQAIYAFRGADVYTYMKARDLVPDHYHLATNWRSSADMIQSVNFLFTAAEKPFGESDIDFLPVNPRDGAEKMSWYLGGKKQKALSLCCSHSDSPLSRADYEFQMTRMTVAKIQQLLEESDAGSAFVEKGKERQTIAPQDIAVLVRTGNQGKMVKEQLAKQGIASVYLSNRDSVFAQDVAMELFYILRAILTPERECYLRAACATRLFSLTADELDLLNQDERLWQSCVDEFISYKEIWQKRGVMPCLRLVLFKRKIPEILLSRLDGERILTDILHIAELLQDASRRLESENALVHWFNERIAEPDDGAQEQQMRLESERNLVQIITIHKSKGLEFNFVFLPFACGFKEQKVALFHDEKKELQLDLTTDSPLLERAEQERLAEDLRLIYVALTRAVYACFVGVSDIKIGSGKKSRLADSAFGYLLLKGKDCSKGYLGAVSELVENSAPICSEETGQIHLDHCYEAKETDLASLEVREMRTPIEHNWHLTSYSALVHQGKKNNATFESGDFDIDAQGEKDRELHTGVSIFEFPKGAAPGTCLHTVFERIDFNSPDNRAEAINIALNNAGIGDYREEGNGAVWQQTIEKLVEDVLSTPLDGKALRLDKIAPHQRLAEMEFIFPIEKMAAPLINKHICREDFLSAKAGMLNFAQMSGMLKGFIDLIFCYEGKYYVLDWKSNFLGSTVADYSQQAMQEAMIAHRYDFQYQLYSLALHRFLRSRIADYDYDKYFGGVYYLFLRGVQPESGQGIFYTKPSRSLIEGLDDLMKGAN